MSTAVSLGEFMDQLKLSVCRNKVQTALFFEETTRVHSCLTHCIKEKQSKTKIKK